MLEYLETTFQIPFIFVILCYAMGTAVIIGTASWARAIANGKYDEDKSLWGGIGAWMLRGWVWVIIFSLSVQMGLWPEYRPEEPTYAPELIILGVVAGLYFLIRIRRGHNVARDIKAESLMLGLYIGIAGAIWAGTIAIFVAIHYISLQIMAAAPFLQGALDPNRDAVMVVGLLWLFPFIHWYQKSQKPGIYDQIKAPEHYKFYMLLWPIVIGLLFFIMPLFAQKLVTSDKFQDMLNAKPSLERV